MAGSPQAMWNRYGVEATAVARSVQCQVPLLPSQSKSDMPSPPKKGKKGREEGDSEYSPWLGMEHYHDRTTGENYGSVRAVTGTKRVRKGRAITLRSVTMSES